MNFKVILVEYNSGYHYYGTFIGFVNGKETLRWSDEVAVRNFVDDLRLVFSAGNLELNVEMDLEQTYREHDGKYVKW